MESGGLQTNDKVFLLNREEVEAYLDQEKMKYIGSPLIDDWTGFGSGSRWCLLEGALWIEYSETAGAFEVKELSSSYMEFYTMRPAMWVSKEDFEKAGAPVQ